MVKIACTNLSLVITPYLPGSMYLIIENSWFSFNDTLFDLQYSLSSFVSMIWLLSLSICEKRFSAAVLLWLLRWLLNFRQASDSNFIVF